jgi:cellulose 1,4-beta-cellobiosidase
MANLSNSVVTRFEQDKITQFFVQNGKKIDIPPPSDSSISTSSAITPDFCKNQFKAFGDRDRFNEVGGFPQLNQALQVPMVLVMSIWDDVSQSCVCRQSDE